MFESLRQLNLGSFASLRGRGGFVALDIGSSSVKMVETSIDKSGYHLRKLGILPVPAKAIQNNMVVDQAPVIEAIKTLIQENNITATHIVSAVPGRAAIMKRVRMPRQDDDELEANVEFEANSVIPENLENVNLDYQVLNLSEDGSQMDVLLVAVKKEIVNSYTEVIEQAGLTPAVIDVDYFAMENMYEASYPSEKTNGVVGLIHMGARYTSITLLQNGISTFTGDLPIGGEEFTDRLRRELNISIDAAENFKVTGSLDGKKSSDTETLLKPIVENVIDEIRRTVSLYGSVGGEEGEGLKHIYLSGGSAKVPGLLTVLGERMGVPVSLAEPFRGFIVNKSIDRTYLANAAPAFVVGAGLSIRRPGDQ
jgi:type IV pilus assembly protein PilM